MTSHAAVTRYAICFGIHALFACFVSEGTVHALPTDSVPEGALLSTSGVLSRDPFQPFDVGPHDSKPRSPLETYDLHALTLVAIIWNSPIPKAMVEDSAGLGYTIEVGTPIGRARGVVKTIEPTRVFVEEEFRNFYGETTKRIEVLELRPGGEKSQL